MKNNNNNNSGATTPKEFNSIKVAKPKIFNDQRTELKNWLFQLKLYFVFNTIKNDRKTLFVVSRMNEKAFNWIKFNMKQFLHNDKDIGGIFNVFDRSKIVIWRVFNVTNEIIIFIKMIQYLLQKTSTVDYAQRFKKYANNISWNDEALIIMFYKDLKSNVKDEIPKKEVQYANFNALIFTAISIDDNWYERVLKDRFEKSICDRANIHHNELIRRREDYYQKNEIMMMKLYLWR